MSDGGNRRVEFSLPVRELRVEYPRGYEHPDPQWREFFREFEEISADVELLKARTAHWRCDGWTTAGPSCSCGVPLADIGTVPPPQGPNTGGHR